MKKAISALISAALVLSLSFPTYATDMSADTQVQTFNEYDYITMLQESPVDKLEAMGLTNDDVNSIVAEFEDALDRRAALSDSSLENLGYSSREISLLRAYASGSDLSDAELQAVTGTCTGYLAKEFCNGSSASFNYSWQWDHCPMMTFSDSAAMRWIAYDSSGHELGIIQTDVSGIVYYWNGDIKHHSWPATQEPNLDFNSVNMQFTVKQTLTGSSGITIDYYAKTGTVTVEVELDENVDNEINYILVAGLYGHTTVGVGSPSIGVGIPGSVSISFSGNTSIDATGARKAKITQTGITYLDS